MIDDSLEGPPAKPSEDVSDWQVRMMSGEILEMRHGVLRYSRDIISIRGPKADGEILLFLAPTQNVDRVRRLPTNPVMQAAA